MKIRAPAKVNLRLRVLGKRQDGYHLIDTILVPVSLFDEIQITKEKRDTRKGAAAGNVSVTCDHPLVPQGRRNLAYQAALLLMQESGIEEPVRIHIRKKIPVGAGLGGGSSDAAATLVGLNRLFGLRYKNRELERLSVSLGTDVPFFVRGSPARARGIGERLSPLKSFPKLWLIILYPGIPVSTAWVYKKFSSKLTKPIVNTSITSLLGSPADLRKLLVNDLESITVDRYPVIGSLKEKLIQQGAVGALMSGSGSSVFGLFNSRQKALKAFRRLRKEEGVEAFLVQVVS